ncbi:MAG TPA: hypothetical protein VJO34_03985 [Methylomirabilota bacterium]|nr:hypothetical protein [Methylomirabilota bacterium]
MLSTVFLGSLILSNPNGASAQDAPLFQLHPSISLTEEYTDNFDRTSANKRENFRTLAAPGLLLKINGAKTKGEVGGSVGFSHDTADEGKAIRANALAGVTWQPNPIYSFQFTDTLTKSDVPGLTGTLGIRRGRAEFLSNNATLISNYQIGNVNTRINYSNVIFEDENPTGEDTLTHTIGGTVAVPILQINTVSAGYTRSFSLFSTSPDTTTDTFIATVSRLVGPFTTVGLTGSSSFINSDGGTDSKIYSAALTGTHSIPQGFSVSARAGYSIFDQDSGGSEGSLSGGLSVSYQFAKATVTVSYDEGFVPTFTGGQNLGTVKNRQVSSTLSYQVTPFVSTGVTGFFAQNEFFGGVGTTADAAPGRKTDSAGVAADIGIQLLRWLRMTLGYGFERFRSNVAGEDFDENKGRVSLTAAF